MKPPSIINLVMSASLCIHPEVLNPKAVTHSALVVQPCMSLFLTFLFPRLCFPTCPTQILEQRGRQLVSHLVIPHSVFTWSGRQPPTTINSGGG